MTLYCMGCGRSRSALWGPCACGSNEQTIEYLLITPEKETVMPKTKKRAPPVKAMPPKKKGC